MPLITIRQTAPSPDGPEVPVSGIIEFTPSQRRVNTGGVVQARPFTIVVGDDGEATTWLAPTGPDWCWQVHEKKFGAPWTQFFVVVPDTETEAYEDLVRVDPRSFAPTAGPDPAWWADLEAAKALAADVEVARAETVENAHTAAGAAATATAAASVASEARDEVVSNRVTAWPDPDNPDLIIISYPGYALAEDGTSIIIPLEVD